MQTSQTICCGGLISRRDQTALAMNHALHNEESLSGCLRRASWCRPLRLVLRHRRHVAPWEFLRHCFSLRHCERLHLQLWATTNSHWARVVGYGAFSLCIIHKKCLCLSSEHINRLMMMMMMIVRGTGSQSPLLLHEFHDSFSFHCQWASLSIGGIPL
jgi:hypothetical protein